MIAQTEIVPAKDRPAVRGRDHRRHAEHEHRRSRRPQVAGKRMAKALPAAKPLKGPATQSLAHCPGLRPFPLEPRPHALCENDGELLTALADSHKLRFYYLSEMKESRRTDVPGMVEDPPAAKAKGDSTRLGAWPFAAPWRTSRHRRPTPPSCWRPTASTPKAPGCSTRAAYSRQQGRVPCC